LVDNEYIYLKKILFSLFDIYLDGAVLHLIITLDPIIFAANIAKTLLWNEINKLFLLDRYFNNTKKQKKYFKYLLSVFIFIFGIATLILLLKEYNLFFTLSSLVFSKVMKVT